MASDDLRTLREGTESFFLPASKNNLDHPVRHRPWSANWRAAARFGPWSCPHPPPASERPDHRISGESGRLLPTVPRNAAPINKNARMRRRRHTRMRSRRNFLSPSKSFSTHNMLTFRIRMTMSKRRAIAASSNRRFLRSGPSLRSGLSFAIRRLPHGKLHGAARHADA